MSDHDTFEHGDDWVSSQGVPESAAPTSDASRAFGEARGVDRMSPYVRNIDLVRAQYQEVRRSAQERHFDMRIAAVEASYPDGDDR